jgi:LmbE family N-acetylglucosaminyl deacetylase
VLNILFIAAHVDDCEVSSAGSWLKLRDEGHKIHYFVAADCEGVSPGSTKESEAVMEYLKPESVTRLSLTNTELPTIENRAKIRHTLEGLRDSVSIDCVYIPWRFDLNQDHQALAEEAIRVFRYSSILQYCVTHSCPNMPFDYYRVLDKKYVDGKNYVLSLFKSQIKRGSVWFIKDYVDSVTAFARSRGLECGYDYAEAFLVYRLIEL